jgi:hypothetical protein
MTTECVENIAIRSIADANPVWSGIWTLRDLVGPRRILLHAGPPYNRRADIPRLIRNSLATASMYEGWAGNWEDAEAMIIGGDVEIAAAQDINVVVPLAGVASPSMALAGISTRLGTNPATYAVLNEGLGCALRLGCRDPRLLNHHNWLNRELADWLADALQEPLELCPLLQDSIRNGDDGHAVTAVGSASMAAALRRRSSIEPTPSVDVFLRECTSFALNIWMALASAYLKLAEGAHGSTIVTRAGSNGVEFGIQLANNPGQWITIEAPRPSGVRDPTREGCAVSRAVGDSAVVDFLGLGGQYIDSSSAAYPALRRQLPADFSERRSQLFAMHLDQLGGIPAVVDARNAVLAGIGPMVLLGMLDEAGEAGRIGAGTLHLPSALFETAINVQGL